MSIPDVSGRSIPQLVSLAGRRAVVTGGAQGLGGAIAHRFAEAGAAVLLGDLKADKARTLAGELRARHGVTALAAGMDVTDEASVAATARRAVEELGGIDIWVNNAGIFPAMPLLRMDVEVWDQVMAVNLRGVFLGAREAARHMIAAGRGGVIVNIVSTAGFKGVAPGLAAYVASKHGARGATRQLALELAPHNIRVLGVAPTYTVTEGNLEAAAAAPRSATFSGDIAAMTGSVLGRIGVPDDIARVVLFCASDMAAFMTGSTLLADAGEIS
ncbi:SDR family NAD(P)-dependent oxidoreductase [Streptomyces sp. NPDC019937]|uniref:SDR family NAD(P)-dependent oxidoreductase n=1 Tax=Streptomyces sp. NPDC019937 TaxID=3154787 RepID=UPI0033C78603